MGAGALALMTRQMEGKVSDSGDQGKQSDQGRGTDPGTIGNLDGWMEGWAAGASCLASFIMSACLDAWSSRCPWLSSSDSGLLPSWAIGTTGPDCTNGR